MNKIECKKCGAKNRRGEPCEAPALRGKNRCRLHGGRNEGKVGKSVRHGRYSKHLPFARLRVIYSQLIAQGFDLYSSDEDIRLLMARQAQLLEQGETRHLWRELKPLWKTMLKGLFYKATEEQRREASQVVGQINSLIESGEAETRRWDEFYEVTEQLDKMRDRALKRDIEQEKLVRVDVALIMFTPIIQALKNVVLDYQRQGKVADSGILAEVIGRWNAMMSELGIGDTTDEDTPADAPGFVS